MIKKLKLTNFRQHHSSEIEFISGINTIVGANNAGKSTIPEAIEFALFGAKALRDTGNAWITDGAAGGSVILTFDEYKVGRDANAAKVYRNGILEADYKANVTKYISQITGVNQAGFRLGHYVRQKELAAFSTLRPGKRQETIERLLKLNAVDKVLATLKESSDVLDVQLKSYLAMAQDADKLSNDMLEAQMERAKLTPIEVDDSKVVALQARIANTRETVATLKTQQLEIDRLRSSINVVTGYEEAEAEFGKYKPISTVELEAKLTELRKAEVLKAKMSSIKIELDKELIEVEQPTKPVRPVEEESAISAAAANLATVKKLIGVTKCPTCLTEIADIDNVINSLEDMLRHAKSDGQPAIDAYNTAQIEFLRQHDVYNQYIADLNRRNELLTKYVEVEFFEEEKQQVETEIEALRTNNKLYVQLKHNFDMAKLKKETQTKAKERLLEIEETFSEESLEQLQEELEDSSKLLTVKTAVLNNQKAQATQILTDIARLEGRIQELQKAVDNANTLRQTITDIAERTAKIKYKYEVYQKFKKYLTAKIRPMIGTVAETLFHKVTKNRYASYQLSNDYEVIINTHQGFVRKLSTISGSENDLANLCLRLSIATLKSNKLTGNLGFIILDEISSSFDEERTKQTLEGLLELKDIIPQIINITHKPVEMKFADKLITIKESNGRASIL